MERIFCLVVSSCTHREFSSNDSSSWFLCDYYNFMFFLPIKISTSTQTHAHRFKSNVYQLGSFSFCLEKTVVLTLFPWCSHMFTSNFLQCSIFYVPSQETYLVVGEIPNQWQSTINTTFIRSVFCGIVPITLLSSMLSKLDSENMIFYVMITHKKSVSYPNEGKYFTLA